MRIEQKSRDNKTIPEKAEGLAKREKREGFLHRSNSTQKVKGEGISGDGVLARATDSKGGAEVIAFKKKNGVRVEEGVTMSPPWS